MEKLKKKFNDWVTKNPTQAMVILFIAAFAFGCYFTWKQW